ncbi:MAG: hypothetical protein Q9195_002266 [Heterodermia aff. obscurata]
MCGIYCSISDGQHVLPSKTEIDLLELRGPDLCNTIRRTVNRPSSTGRHYLTFCASVLSLRGSHVVQQPLEDSVSESLLCWNGEAWRYDGKEVQGNDAQLIFHHLLEAAKGASAGPDLATSDRRESLGRVLSVVSMISGPFAFVFYDSRSRRILFGRDILGRRALLTTTAIDGSVIISSVSGDSTSDDWKEVEADGIYIIDIDCRLDPNNIANTFSHDTFNGECPPSQLPVLSLDSSAVTELAGLLRSSSRVRVQDIPRPPLVTCAARLAILFSGGLDCMLLARLCHDMLPKTHEVDLLNVAFENPRVVKAATQNPAQISGRVVTVYSECPDRVTGLKAHKELLHVCPGRIWRFVSINVSYKELLAHRPQIQSLMRPHNTEMDLSIASALYFAARGEGTAHNSSSGLGSPYASPARVLLSGLGADELFAGYTRHATAFTRNGHEGLAQELELDFQRLGKRNLGRDDRVISHWGKEARYPYLDEILVEWALRIPIWEKCGFGQTVPTTSSQDSHPPLQPAKKALRLLAWKLGMSQVALEPKRAIQFGARTAKMESGKIKGTQTLF